MGRHCATCRCTWHPNQDSQLISYRIFFLYCLVGKCLRYISSIEEFTLYWDWISPWLYIPQVISHNWYGRLHDISVSARLVAEQAKCWSWHIIGRLGIFRVSSNKMFYRRYPTTTPKWPANPEVNPALRVALITARSEFLFDCNKNPQGLREVEPSFLCKEHGKNDKPLLAMRTVKSAKAGMLYLPCTKQPVEQDDKES